MYRTTHNCTAMSVIVPCQRGLCNRGENSPWGIKTVPAVFAHSAFVLPFRYGSWVFTRLSDRRATTWRYCGLDSFRPPT